MNTRILVIGESCVFGLKILSLDSLSEIKGFHSRPYCFNSVSLHHVEAYS
jgi:hypothetical protein